MALPIRLKNIFSTSPKMLNSGSSSVPLTGRRRSISPRLFLSSDTASCTGRFTASGLSTLSPKVSWSRKIWLVAVSLRSSIL